MHPTLAPVAVFDQQGDVDSADTRNTVHSIDLTTCGGTVQMSYFEKDAILSGIGISRIGRRTGIPGLDLTMEAVRAAIDDAGLVAADIDGIATLGDTQRPTSTPNSRSTPRTAEPGSAPEVCSVR